MNLTTYVYEAMLVPAEKLAAGTVRFEDVRPVEFAIESPFNHFDVTDNRHAEAIEAAVQAHIKRLARYGEVCSHRRIKSPARPPRPPRRPR